MDILVEGTLSSAMEEMFVEAMPSDQKELVLRTLYQRLNATNLEYASMKKLFAEKDEDLKDTLVWEFAKGLSQLIVGGDHGIAYIYMAVPLVTGSLEVLDIQGTLNQIAK